MKLWRLVALVALLAALVLGLWAFVFEPASLTSSRHELSIPRWTPQLAGLKVAVLSDLHVGSPFNQLDKLERIIDLANSLDPDVIVLPGDFVIDAVLGGTFVPPESTAAALARLKAPLGVWAVLGNHDWWLGRERVIAAFEKAGIRMLEDKAVRLERRGEHFWLAGLTDFNEGPHDEKKALAHVTDEAPVVMITHNPDAFPTLGSRESLVIAGHTHGGQVVLPFIGRPIVPSKYDQRFAYGHVVEGGRHLFVSPGLGTSILAVRFRVPPEVTLLVLNP